MADDCHRAHARSGSTAAWWLAAFAFAYPAFLAGEGAKRSMELTPCAREAGVPGAECGTLEVFENRAAAQGRIIPLKVIVLPSLGLETKPDALFLLAGGPGMPASELANFGEKYMRRIRESREIVLVDQRGTGDLSLMQCSDNGMEGTYFDIEEKYLYETLRNCLEEFDADPRHYTTPVAMDDLDDVRAALGYEEINLWGGSYGTRAALIYLRRHPERTRALILDGVAPTAIRLPLHAGEDAHRAMELMLDHCEADSDCTEAFPELRQKYSDLLQRSAKTPEKVNAPHPRTGEPLDLELDREKIVLLLRAVLYNADATRLLPLVIERAHAGDFGPLLALNDPIGDSLSKINVPMMFSILCAEDIRLVSENDLAQLSEEPFLGSNIIDRWKKVCEFWPAGELPPGYHDPVVSDKPVLILSGDLDPVTPPRWGEYLTQHLTNSLHVIVPGAAHGTSGHGCVPKMMYTFLDQANFAELETGCVDQLTRPMFFQSFAGPRVGAAPAEGGTQ
jgi:pimeloyl-ACP methyl ester carboxylesterase